MLPEAARNRNNVIDRIAHPSILTALADTRVVAVLGARQVGKSTLTWRIATADRPMAVVNLDDATLRDAAASDPAGFLAGYGRPVLIDEVQRAPDLLLAIKEIVDADTTPGQFLLTGSANILTAPKIQDALTGRAEYVTLWPFAQAEIASASTNFVDRLLDADPPRVEAAPVGRDAFVDVIARGGYPEARARSDARRRTWYRDYITSLVERDLRDISDARRLHVVPKLLRLLAAQAANLFNSNSIAGKLNIRYETVADYTQLLETIYIVRRVQAWTPGLGSREIQHEKVYIVDSGLMAYLLGADRTRIAEDVQITGKILENFVAMEIARLAETSRLQPRQYHYRRRDHEVDVVLETPDGRIAGAEVKAAATVRTSDYKGLAKLRGARGDEFIAGVVFYTGARTIALTDRIWAVPICSLWTD